MNIEHIAYIIEVSKCQSITQASKNLFIGQSTLSNIICTFENELKVKLFYRTNKGVRLTEIGEQILPELKELLSHQNNIHNIVSALQKKTNPLHITVYPAGETSVMVDVLGTIQQRFPESNLHFSVVRPESIIRKMLYSGSTIGLGALGELRYHVLYSEAENHNFSCHTLYRDVFFLYVGKNHPLARCTSVNFSEIIDEKIVLLSSLIMPGENSFYSDFQKLNHITTFDNYESIKRSIMKHSFIAVAPGLAFYDDIYCKYGEIVQIPLTNLHKTLVNFLITPKDETELTIHEQAIICEIQRFFKGLSTSAGRNETIVSESHETGSADSL